MTIFTDPDRSLPLKIRNLPLPAVLCSVVFGEVVFVAGGCPGVCQSELSSFAWRQHSGGSSECLYRRFGSAATTQLCSIKQSHLQIHWNPLIVDFFVQAKSSTIEGFSTNEGFLCSEKSFSQA